MFWVSNQEHRSLVERELTHILNLKLLSIVITQIKLQSPIEQFQKHLKATFGNGRVVTAFAEFVADECICLVLSIFRGCRHA